MKDNNNLQDIFNKIIKSNFSIIFSWFLATQTNSFRFNGEKYLFLDVGKGLLSIENTADNIEIKSLIDYYENNSLQQRRIAGEDFDFFYEKIISRIKNQYVNNLKDLYKAKFYIENIVDKQKEKELPYVGIYWNL